MKMQVNRRTFAALAGIAYQVGKKLTFDAARECFNDDQANALLTR